MSQTTVPPASRAAVPPRAIVPPRVRAAVLWVAAALATTGLVLIWVARLSADRFLYVSELGAAVEPTAEVFRVALACVAAGAALVAVAAPRMSPRTRLLTAVPPGVVLAVAAVSFGVASQVTCTQYCPLPVGPAFTWQDLIHTVSAVIGFAGAAFVMLQVASDTRFRRLARFSAFSAVSVAVIAGVGGLLSLLRFGTQVGGVLEFVATTIALLWLVGLAVLLAVETARSVRPSAGTGQLQPSHPATPDRVAATYAE
ncbi:DUF998 domain-containing protein [Herbiconiux sp.]|uniref:DUF998 domain-containing protein n=1 Tax=Herbiconiux sp. TaxID=1871186 RepID=UPI0025C3AF83|nr:DUF998 domain-containing protein [Herbiconiux sp.]